jgi:mono/diheme cytochrome c family protein
LSWVGWVHQDAPVRLPRALVRATARFAALTVVGAVALAACGGEGEPSARPRTGADLYRAYCLTCHGADGQGGVGPALAGVVAVKYPDIEDQLAVVAEGTARMPSFAQSLSSAEIRRIVVYERTKLGT